MGPKRGAGMTGRGRVRRGRGGRTPRSSRGGRRGAALIPSSSSSDEGFWHYEFLLRVRGRNAARILLASAFSALVSERSLDGLLLRLQGCAHSPSYVKLEIDSSRLIFLGFGWKSFARRLNLRDGDTLCCRFDGEDTLIIRAFDPSGNRMDPYWPETSRDGSDRSRSPSPASSTASSSGESSGADVEPSSTASSSGEFSGADVEPSSTAASSGSEDDLDVKPPIKRACQATL